MKTFLFSPILILLLLSSTIHAADHSTKLELYKELYYDSYRPRHCGLNIKEFVEKLDAAGVSLKDYDVLVLRATMTMLGMLNAQKVRDGEKTFEKNWYFHVVLVDQNNLVYDFSFMTEPTVMDFHDYMEEMFLIEPECEKKPHQRGTRFCIGRKEKLNDYRLEWISAEDYLNGSEEPYRKTKLKDHF